MPYGIISFNREGELTSVRITGDTGEVDVSPECSPLKATFRPDKDQPGEGTLRYEEQPRTEENPVTREAQLHNEGTVRGEVGERRVDILYFKEQSPTGRLLRGTQKLLHPNKEE